MKCTETRPNVVKDKSFAFALKVVRYISAQRYDWCSIVIFKQLLRSATSIGANIEEAHGAQSDKDFVAKLYISNKEIMETLYWLRLCREANANAQESYNEMIADAEELKKIVSSIIISTKRRLLAE